MAAKWVASARPSLLAMFGSAAGSSARTTEPSSRMGADVSADTTLVGHVRVHAVVGQQRRQHRAVPVVRGLDEAVGLLAGNVGVRALVGKQHLDRVVPRKAT